MPKPPSLKSRHIPLRRCVVCRESKPQAELMRFYLTEGAWQLDPGRKAGGRGAWLCLTESCHLEKSLKRFFRQDAEQIKEQISTYLTSKNKAKSLAQKPQATRIRVATGGMNV